jgi:murein DD-endopeptidase MepM/ murein hydrolase activator NlpD
MSRMNHDKSRSFFGGRGFYIALVLCLAAIGVAGYFVLVQQAKVAEEGKDKPVVRQETVENVQQAQVPDPEPVQETLEPEELLPQVCSPLDGTTVTVFSMTELMYDETMADWRTHDGVDIKAGEGDAVKTAADGTVKEVRYDDLMGVTVVISHADGYETQYSSLQQEPPVEQGKTVKAGDIIGLVGSTAAAEGDVGPHLHFSVSKDGKVVDPQEYVK